jgi:hypothetical protein
MVSFRHYRKTLITLVVLAGLFGGLYLARRAWIDYQYPFGPSHCCDKQLMLGLRMYADNNGGAFPTGEVSPEASISLIHSPTNGDYAYLLCGKTGSESVAKQILNQGKLLGPGTCGWNYVEDLRTDDDLDLALFWDKEGLGHNGERLEGGGHIVTFIGGSSRHIPAVKWSAFLTTQSQLFAIRKNTQKDQQ